MCPSCDDTCLEIIIANSWYWTKKPFHPPLLSRLIKLRSLFLAQKLASAVTQLKCVAVGRTQFMYYRIILLVPRSVCVWHFSSKKEPSYTRNDEQCHHFVLL